MTDEQAHQGAATGPGHASAEGSPGRILRDGRERLNLTTKQVAERLRLRHQIVLDLEEDQFSRHVASTFTRGYLRAYARLVGVNDEQVLNAYEALGVSELSKPMQSFSRRTRQQSQDKRLMFLTYLIGALIIGSAIIFWFQNKETNDPDTTSISAQQNLAETMVQQEDEPALSATDNTDESLSRAEAEPLLSEPVIVDTSVLEINSADEPELTTQSTETVPNDATPEESEPEVAELAADQISEDRQELTAETTIDNEATSAEEPVSEGELVLSFRGDTWIRVEDASGEAIAFGVKPGGHTTELNGQEPYQLTLGAPENVDLFYRGNQIDLSSYRAGRVARLTIPLTE